MKVKASITIVLVISVFLALVVRQAYNRSQLAASGPLPRTVVVKDKDGIDTCCSDSPLPTTDRTEFDTKGCMIYGYPSSGGVLIKEADGLDMDLLLLPRTENSFRANDTSEEDEFCYRLRRVGATLWFSKEQWHDRFRKARYLKDKQKRVMFYGWPNDGKGVWVLRYERDEVVPRGIGRVRMAKTMEEKITAMRQLNATFVADPLEVDELQDWEVPPPTLQYEDIRMNASELARFNIKIPV